MQNLEYLKEVGKVLKNNYEKALAEKLANPDIFDAERELHIILYEEIQKETDKEFCKILKVDIT